MSEVIQEVEKIGGGDTLTLITSLNIATGSSWTYTTKNVTIDPSDYSGIVIILAINSNAGSDARDIITIKGNVFKAILANSTFTRDFTLDNGVSNSGVAGNLTITANSSGVITKLLLWQQSSTSSYTSITAYVYGI